jgi:energy-converting hydrogenase Eha subunit A
MPQLPGNTPKAPKKPTGKKQAAWGAWVIIAGLAAIVIIFGLAIARFDNATQVSTAVSAVSGVIAAIVGAYFGLRGSSIAQAQMMEMMGTPQKPKDPPAPLDDPSPKQPPGA